MLSLAVSLFGLLDAKALTPETMQIGSDGLQKIVRRVSSHQSMEPGSSFVEQDRAGVVPITPNFKNGNFEHITEAVDDLGAPIIIALAKSETYDEKPIVGWDTTTPKLVTLMPSDPDAGMTTANGGVFCALRNKDVGGKWTKAEISQEVSDLAPGKKYQLAFKEASEDSPSKAKAEIEILLEGASSDDPLACEHKKGAGAEGCDKPHWHQVVPTAAWTDTFFTYETPATCADDSCTVKFTIRNRSPRTDHADHEPTLLVDAFDISDAQHDGV